MAALLMVSCQSGDGSEAPPASGGNRPLLIAPLLSNTFFCDAARGRPDVVTEDQAALLCAALGQTAGARIDSSLQAVGPELSPSGKFRLGYTMILPLFRYYRRTPEGWVFDAQALRANLATLDDSTRPVVVHLSGTHFNFSALELSAELAQDSRNVMWTRDGPAQSADYFGVDVTGWSLVDLDAPVNRMRSAALRAVVEALCELPARARDRIAAITILGETHYVFPSLRAGPGDAVAAKDLTDYSPAMRQGFKDWLRGRFADVSALNEALGSRYTAFLEVEPPSRQFGVEPVASRLEHVDSYSSGRVPVYGWVHARSGGDVIVTVALNGGVVGEAKWGLSRTDVTEANASITDPNVGFRFDLDYRRLPPGRHTIDVLVRSDGGVSKLLASRTIRVISADLSEVETPHGTSRSQDSAAEDPNLIGALDGPPAMASALHNPLAELWMAYREQVVLAYYEHFARLTASACFSSDKIYAHQILPALYGGWNDEVLAVGASQRRSALFRPGATLYGGTAFGRAFFQFKEAAGWGGYGVNEMHPLVPLSPDGYRVMFETHRLAGADFLAPYYMESLPVFDGGDALDRYLISPRNPRLASDRFHAALQRLMSE